MSAIIVPSATLDNVPGASGPAQSGHLVYAVNAGLWYFFTWTTKLDSGTASATSTTAHLIDTTKTWTTNQFLGRTCIITGGTGSGQSFIIGSNNATTLPVVDDAGLSTIGTAPNATSTYEIIDSDSIHAYVSSSSDLSSATWSEATGSPTPNIQNSGNNIGYGISVPGGSNNVGGSGQYPTDGRMLLVAYANVSGIDVFLLGVQMDSHYFQITMRGRLTAATTVAWDGVISGTTNNWNDTAPGMDCVPQFPDGFSLGYSSTGKWWQIQDQNGRVSVGYAANSADPGTANFNENWQGNNGGSAPTSWDTGGGDMCQSALMPLASGFMLAVYCNGNTASPAGNGNATQTGLRYAESASATQWPTTSTGAAVPNLSSTSNDPNDWGIVARTNADIHVVRRNAGTTLEQVRYSGHGGSWGSKVNLPTTGLTGQLAGSGVALVSDGTNVWCFVIDTDANHSIRYVKWNGSSWATSWSTLTTGSEVKNYIAAYMRSDNNQIGVVWTANSSSPYQVNVAALNLTQTVYAVAPSRSRMLARLPLWLRGERAYMSGQRVAFPVAAGNVSLSLTASDSVTQITDSATRLIALGRTATDSVTQITDSAVRGAMSFLRTAADSPTQISDSAARLLALARTGADSVTQISDSAIRLIALARTAPDSVTQITDSAVRAPMNFVRTAADSPTLSDAVTRLVALARTAADSVTQITDSAISAHGVGRTAVDSVTQITDSAVRAAMSFVRTASDAPVLAEVAVRSAMAFVRTAVDSVTQITDSAISAHGIARFATDSVTQITDSAVRAAMSFVRTASDAPVLAEVAVRSALAFVRTAADSITQPSDSATRLLILARTASDSVTQISDAAVRAALALVRIASDAVTAITDAAVATTSSGNHIVRTAADSVSQISDSAVRSAINFLRTATDAPTALSDLATQVRGLPRTAADSVHQLSDSASKLMGVVRAASDSVTQISDSAVRAAINLLRNGADSVVQVAESAVGIISGPGVRRVAVTIGRPFVAWVGAIASWAWKTKDPDVE